LFLVVKFAAVPIKFANNWRYAQHAFVQIEQVDAPLTSVRVLQPERLRLDVQMLLWIVDLKLLEIGVAIEELLMVGDAIVLDPIVGTDEAIGKPAHVSLPVADKKVEVARSIAGRRRRRFSYRRAQS
jgi:hypothetical protein